MFFIIMYFITSYIKNISIFITNMMLYIVNFIQSSLQLYKTSVKPVQLHGFKSSNIILINRGSIINLFYPFFDLILKNHILKIF